MKINKLFVAALAAMTMFSCSKEEGAGGSINGGESKFGLSFTLPQSSGASKAGTRATQDALATESEFANVTIYVFQNGAAAKVGGFTQLTKSDFDEPSTGKYTLKTAKNIETVAGSVSIYVALNLPTAVDVAYASEAAFRAVIESIGGATGMSTDNKFTMVSDVQKPILEAFSVASKIETANFEMGRVVSKVVASTNKSDNVFTTNLGDAGNAVEYTVKSFGVYNESTKSYLAPRATGEATYAGAINTYAASVAKPNAEVLKNPATADLVAATAAQRFYIGENWQLQATNGKTTYAMIATTIKMEKAATWNATTKGVDYVAVPAYGQGASGSDVFIVKYQGLTFVTNSNPDASAIVSGIAGRDNVAAGAADYPTIYTYPAGWVHFVHFLNREGTNDYRVGRNEFIHLEITGIKNFVGGFPGYPGTTLDPEKPTDPTTTDPTNPTVLPPTGPVDPELATLNVTVTVKPWEYKNNNVILQ